MVRPGFSVVFLGLVLAACDQTGNGAGATPPTLEALADAHGGPPPPPEMVAPMHLRCGEESFRVAFEEAKAIVVLESGESVELHILPPPQDALHATFTDGRMTFTKEGGGNTPTVIRFARGRMAFQDCAIAQH